MSNFRFNGKYGLLTYAQCGDLDPWRVNEMLGNLGAECIIGRESHSDEGIHLHAFFMFERPFQTRNQRKFDVDGCHPNIVRGYGTPEKGYDYATKDGDVVAGGLGRPSGSNDRKKDNSWEIIANCDTVQDFWATLRELQPRALHCSFNSLKAYADWRFREEPDPYKGPEDIHFDTSSYPELAEWVTNLAMQTES